MDGIERHGVLYSAARWTGAELGALVRHLYRRGRPALEALRTAELIAAWEAAVEDFLDPGSPPRRELEAVLPRFCRLSPEGLEAALEAVLGGVRGEPLRRLAGAAAPAADGRPVVVVLASNLPALAVQPLLPALLLRRPTLLKSPSAEPLFTPAFIHALARAEPRLAPALAAVTWPGGRAELEEPLLAAAGRVVAYGEAESLDDLERRAPGKLVPYGPRTSLALVGAAAEPVDVAPGLARDVALFDQRGCLSIQAVYTCGDPRPLADRLAAELERLAERWPPGPAEPAVVAGVQQVRMEADLRGLHRPRTELAAATVVVDPESDFRPSPGMRTVRVHPLADAARLPPLLAGWKDRLQGAALAGADAWRQASRLEGLGISRLAEPGELQSPDALWHNGGRHPLVALGGAGETPPTSPADP